MTVQTMTEPLNKADYPPGTMHVLLRWLDDHGTLQTVVMPPEVLMPAPAEPAAPVRVQEAVAQSRNTLDALPDDVRASLDALVTRLATLTDEQRVDAVGVLTDAYCPHCGRVHAPRRQCQCTNDE